MTTTDLAGLIERLEKAAGPDRQLDADIEVLAAYNPKKTGWAAPPFTGSLDAALTLVPEGWRVCEMARPGSEWSAEVISRRSFKIGRHAQLPLALSIAALKARSQS